MRAIVNGLFYDTDTAEFIAAERYGSLYSDPDAWDRNLFRTEKGNFFLQINGGPMSRYAKGIASERKESRHFFQPISEQEAKEFLEGLDDRAVDAYINCFGEPELA